MRNHIAVQSYHPAITVLKITCPMHQGEPHTLTVSTDGFDTWTNGAMVQDAFPGLDANDRERLINGICPDCFDRLFKE